MTERTTLVGEPMPYGFERHYLPGCFDPVIARPGQVQIEREVLAGGQIVRSRWLLVDGEKETVLQYFMEPA